MSGAHSYQYKLIFFFKDEKFMRAWIKKEKKLVAEKKLPGVYAVIKKMYY